MAVGNMNQKPSQFLLAFNCCHALGSPSVGAVWRCPTAIADFVILDMFANYCTGREDVKGAIAVAERQLRRIYR